MLEALVPGQIKIEVDKCKLCGKDAYEYKKVWVKEIQHAGYWNVISERAINTGTCPKDRQGRHTITGM